MNNFVYFDETFSLFFFIIYLGLIQENFNNGLKIIFLYEKVLKRYLALISFETSCPLLNRFHSKKKLRNRLDNMNQNRSI